jgi:hypothetical protein
LVSLLKKIAAALQRKATRQPRTAKIVVEMHGGTIETIDHDIPGVKIEAIFTEDGKYTNDPDSETWVDKERFVYTRSTANFDEKHVDRIFAAAGKKGKGGRRGKAKADGDGSKASESAGTCTAAA